MLIALLSWLLWVGEPPRPGFLIITSSDTPLSDIRLSHLRQVYLKKRERLGRVRVTPLHLADNHPLRHAFEEAVYPKHFDVDTYWLQQRLQGGEPPPLEVAEVAFMLVYVERNPRYIGYVPESKREALDALKLKVLTLTK